MNLAPYTDITSIPRRIGIIITIDIRISKFVKVRVDEDMAGEVSFPDKTIAITIITATIIIVIAIILLSKLLVFFILLY